MSLLKLTSWQRRHLERQLEQTRDARLYRRTLALLALAQGQSAADIATLLCVTRQSIYNWVEPYTHSGQPAPLADGDRKGRPRRLGDDEEAFLRTLLAASPQELDYPNVSWTVPMLQEVLYLGTSRERTVRRALERLDYVWKRPRYVLAPDAEREKKTAYPAANPGLPRRSVVLAEDETDLLLFPSLRAGWCQRGEAAKVWLSGRNARRVIFGVMNLRTGWRLLLPRKKGKSEDYRAFLDEVEGHYRGWHVALLLDEDTCHTAQASIVRQVK